MVHKTTTGLLVAIMFSSKTNSKRNNMPKKSKRITIELTPKEAKALYEITCCVGGSPDKTRGQIDNIRFKLIDKFSLWDDANVDTTISDIQSAVHFVP